MLYTATNKVKISGEIRQRQRCPEYHKDREAEPRVQKPKGSLIELVRNIFLIWEAKLLGREQRGGEGAGSKKSEVTVLDVSCDQI